MVMTTSGKNLRAISPYPYIHDEILFFNILKTLPVKSLLRFKCVSKHWKAMIEDPKFIQLHMISAKQKSSSSIVGLFQVKRNGTTDYFFIPKESLGYFCIQTSKWTCIVGVSNGLLCIRSSYGFEICNPGTCEFLYHPLPKSPPRHCFTCYGFGYDPLKNEYKVVQIVCGSENFCRCMVYTLGSGSNESWKDITAVSHLSSCLNHYFLEWAGGLESVVNPDRGAYSKGALHWFIRDAQTIMSFDIHHEKFALIRGPTAIKSISLIVPLFITEWHDCICLGFQTHSRMNSVRLFVYTLDEHQHLDPCMFDIHIWPTKIIAIDENPTASRSRTGCLGGESRLLYWFADGHLSLYSPDKDEVWHDYNPKYETRERFPLPPCVDESLITEYEFMHHNDNPHSLKTLLPSSQCKGNSAVQVSSVSSL